MDDFNGAPWSLNDNLPALFTFGFPQEGAFFEKEHPRFVAALSPLADTQEKIMQRTFVPDSEAAMLIYFSGSIVMEDFSELWVLAGNGCGVGALKILRGMYERTVTAAYISKFPDQSARFFAYGAIADRRLMNNAKEIYGADRLNKDFKINVDGVESAYQEVLADFKETLCEPCNKTRTAFSWSKLDLANMAKKRGYGLENWYFHAYAIPTQQAHSTVLAIRSRLKMTNEGHFFEREAEHSNAALAAAVGHFVLIRMLRIQESFFSLGLAAEIAERETECKNASPGVEEDVTKNLTKRKKRG